MNSDSYNYFNIAFLLYNNCIIEVYLCEFNKLIQQFWICSNSYKFLNYMFISFFCTKSDQISNPYYSEGAVDDK